RPRSAGARRVGRLLRAGEPGRSPRAVRDRRARRALGSRARGARAGLRPRPDPRGRPRAPARQGPLSADRIRDAARAVQAVAAAVAVRGHPRPPARQEKLPEALPGDGPPRPGRDRARCPPPRRPSLPIRKAPLRGPAAQGIRLRDLKGKESDMSMPATNLILRTDSYKASHFLQYPPGTTRLLGYFESRGGL